LKDVREQDQERNPAENDRTRATNAHPRAMRPLQSMQYNQVGNQNAIDAASNATEPRNMNNSLHLSLSCVPALPHRVKQRPDALCGEEETKDEDHRTLPLTNCMNKRNNAQDISPRNFFPSFVFSWLLFILRHAHEQVDKLEGKILSQQRQNER